MQSGLRDARQSADLTADRIVVNKSKREMWLLREGETIRRYAIGLGTAPVGPKERDGDGKTPEGLYAICGRNPASKYHLSLRISYPNAADIARAREAGVDPGGDIMIHGLPNREGGRCATDWTAGCIAVTDEEMDEIWRLVPDGTAIEINP